MIEFDYIVVGAGSAGCAVANRLSAHADLDVLVLEAGSRDWSPYLRIPAGRIRMSDRYDWAFPAEPDQSRNGVAEPWEAGKVLGGSSAINGMLWVRGTAEDYDGWEKLGCTGWGYESVLPFLKNMETFEGGGNDLRGGSGPQSVSYLHLHHELTDQFVEAAKAAGYAYLEDYNAIRKDGVGYGQLSQKRGLRHSSASAYLAPVRRRKNLRIRTRAFVRRVLFNGTTAIGIEYEWRGKMRTAMCRREVIVSAGALMSPKLLMVSGVGPGDLLRSHGVDVVSESLGVGLNLQNHFGVTLLHEVSVPTLNREINPRNVVKHGLDLVLHGRGAATSAFGHAVVFGSVDGGSQFEATFSPFGRFLQKENGRGRHKLQVDSTNAVTTRVGIGHPRPRGAVSIRSAEPVDPPLINFEFADERRDIDELTSACQEIRRVLRTSPMLEHLVREIKPGDEVQTPDQWEKVIRRLGGSKHPAGSCKMGIDELSVVDPELRVRGVEGVRVIDLSVTPNITSGNTNSTAILIGERGSAMILDDA